MTTPPTPDNNTISFVLAYHLLAATNIGCAFYSAAIGERTLAVIIFIAPLGLHWLTRIFTNWLFPQESNHEN